MRPATLVSVAALFVALTGPATAAIVISGKNIRNGSITGVDFKNRSIRPADLANAAVLRGKRGDRGERGSPGLQGPPGLDAGPGADSSQIGPAGPRGRTVVRWVGVIDYDYDYPYKDTCTSSSYSEAPGYDHPLGTWEPLEPGEGCNFVLSHADADKQTSWATMTPAVRPAGVAKVTVDRLAEQGPGGPYSPYFRIRFLDADGQPIDARATLVLYSSAKEPTL